MAIPRPGRLVRRFVTGGALGVADELRPELEEQGREIAVRVAAVGAGAVAALVTRKLVKILWKAITGTEEPDPENPATPWSVAIGWTVSIGVGASVGGLVGRRLAHQGMKKLQSS
jgi:hypothetical protein